MTPTETAKRRRMLCALLAMSLLGPVGSGCSKDESAKSRRPSILLAISDDQSWRHTSATGDPVVKTPAFDRIAREGALFTHAFVASPSCSPSRAAILASQEIWRLGAAANQLGALDAEFDVFPDLLEAQGYYVGFTGKGWFPGSVADCGRSRNPAGNAIGTLEDGRPVENFRRFLDERPDDRPFCFWFGSLDPHAPHTAGTLATQIPIDSAIVPAHLPDDPKVRRYLMRYMAEIEHFDHDLAQMLSILEKRGELENTLVIVTSDNGIDLPRGKINLYDYGTRVPMAVAWPAKMPGGRVVDDFTSLTDLGPTFLELAGARVPDDMTGKSLVEVLLSDQSGRIDKNRDHIVLARERHSPYRENNFSYPVRAIRTHDYLYLHNFAPERWPGGDPPYYADSGGGPWVKKLILGRMKDGDRRYFDWCFNKRPLEELYDLRADPDQLHNVASEAEYETVKRELWGKLKTYLEDTGDPRIFGRDGGWDTMKWPGRWKREFARFRPKSEPAPRGRSRP